MKYLKNRIFNKMLLTIAFVLFASSSINANSNLVIEKNRYTDLNYEYFYSANSTVSVNVKRFIANDKYTSEKILEILTNDNDIAVWLLATENLKNL